MRGPPNSRELESVLREARDLARASGRRTSSAHLLLALFTVPNQAQHFLRELAVDEDALLQKLSAVQSDPNGMLDAVLRRAAKMARGTRSGSVTSLHLLTALSGFKDCGAYGLMSQTGVDLAGLRTTAMGLLLGDGLPVRYRVRPGEAPTPRRDAGGEVGDSRSGRRAGASVIGFHPQIESQAQGRRKRRKATSSPPSPPPPHLEGRAGGGGAAPDPTAHTRDLARRLFGTPRFRKPEPPSGAPGETEAEPAKAAQKKPPARPKAAADEDDPGSRFELDSERFPTLVSFGRNLNAEAARGQIDPVIGRDREIGQLVDILNKRRANNPVLLGDPGVGKTAVVEGLARLIASEAVPPGLEDRVIVELEAGRVLSGTGLRGSLAERLIALKDEVAAAEGRVIVFLDEVHRWIGPGSEQTGDGVEELKPALARGAFPTIGATTHDEFRRSIEADPAFGRRLQAVRIEEPSVEETVRILEGLEEDYGAHHSVSFQPEALEAAARLSHRYLPDRRNPDKALAVLDLAGSKARRQGAESVQENLIAEVVAEMAGLPASKLLMSDRERFLQMEDHLMGAIVGHERNLGRIAHVLRRNYAGFVSGRPIGSFLFLGPTGVGKTETAKVLADFLFHDREATTVLDMSEFSERHAVARLVGSPPGYVGHHSGGQLTEAIRQRPYQLVLLDEIEKADAAVHNLLLQLLDEGRLTDSKGRLADFSNAVVVMTSNLGSEAAKSGAESVGFGRAGSDAEGRTERVKAAARKELEPELWNRIDEVLVFESLTKTQVERIAHLKLQQSSRRLLDEKGIAYTCTPAVVDFLIEHGGFDAALGARPLRRALERYVEAPIADLILRGEVGKPAEIQVDVEGGELVFDVS